MFTRVSGLERQKNRPCYSVPTVLATNLIKKCKLWMDKLMCAAMEVVKGGIGTYYTAIEHGVPRMTLQNRVSS